MLEILVNPIAALEAVTMPAIGDGLVVSILAFYSDDPSSNPAGY